jgi:hypothetical protein
MRRPADLSQRLKSRPPCDSGEVLGRAQDLLAALADVEVEYEIACERLDRWLAPVAVKDRVAATLSHRRFARRAPLESALTQVQQELFSTVLQ